METQRTLAPETKDWRKALASLLVTGALLGLSTNLAKVAGEIGLAPLPFLAWSIAGAALLLSLRAGLLGRWPKPSSRSLEYCLIAALISVALPNLIFFAAVPHVGASFVALAITFPPLITYLAAIALGMDALKPWRAAGVLLALLGSGLIAFFKLEDAGEASLWIWLTLAGPLILAAGNIYRSRRWPAGAQPDALATGMVAVAALLLLAAGLVPGLSLALPLDRPGPLLLVLVQTAVFALQYLLFFVLQKHGGPVYLSLLGSVGAVTGVPVAILLLGEDPPRGLAVGALLIAAGIALLTRQAGLKTSDSGAAVAAKPRSSA